MGHYVLVGVDIRRWGTFFTLNVWHNTHAFDRRVNVVKSKLCVLCCGCNIKRKSYL